MKAKRLVSFCLILTLALGSLPAFAEEAFSAVDPRYSLTPLSFLTSGQIRKGISSAPVCASPRKGAQELTRMTSSDQWEVISQESKYCRVRLPESGGFGYVQNSQLIVNTEIADPALPEALCSTLSLTEAAPFRKEEFLSFEGSVHSDDPVDTLLLYVWDERLLCVERTWAKQLDRPATDVDASVLQKAIPLTKLSGGRKQIVLEGCTHSGTIVLFRSAAYVSRDLEEPAHITSRCKGIPGVVRDGKVSTAWIATRSKPSLEVQLPVNEHAALMTLEWKVPSKELTVTQLDQSGSVISEECRTDGFFMTSVPLLQDTRKVIVKPEDGYLCALSELRIYAEGYPYHAVQQWETVPEKIDILLVSTHQDDEFLFFGGSIPYYSWRDDVTIAVVYMANCGRLRYREALNGLWCAGLKYHPLCLGLDDYLTYNVEEAAAKWRSDDPEKLLTRIIRQYKPEVILTQDFNGEYGHAQHKVTTRTVTECLKLAEQADYDPESAETWGVWSVRKLYVHLYDQNEIRMNWEQALTDPVITPMFLAKEGFDKNKSQQAYFSMERQGNLYDNHLFGLYYSSVGPDVLKNDFMENIPGR